MASEGPTTSRLGAADRRETIARAALEVFARRGYDAASMRQIAARAGISVPVVYDHFDSKRALHIELLERQGTALLAHAARYFAAATSADDLIRIQARAFFEFVEEHPYAWRMIFRDAPADAAVAAARARVLARANRSIAALLELSPALAASAPVPPARGIELMAVAVRAAFDGLAAWWWDHPEVPREELVTVAVDVVWIGIERLREGSR